MGDNANIPPNRTRRISKEMVANWTSESGSFGLTPGDRQWVAFHGLDP